jgi:putative DNA primase/helicase
MRFVNTSEPRGTVELDEERMKSVTTGGRIKADKKFKDAREFSTILKLWVETNHLPRVKDMTDGFWRRVRLLGFLAHFAVPEKMMEGDLPIDIYITRDLAAEAEGILWWVVQGAKKYLEDGLKTPPEVFDASDEYREDQDDFGQFITECLEFVDGARSKSEELHAAYTRWALKQGQDKPMWIRTFTTVLKERYPTIYRRTATERYFDGVKVRKAYEPPPDY